MRADLLVGIDVGTTMTKAVVTSTAGRELSWGRAPTEWRAVPTGGEADPAAFLRSVAAAAGGALQAAPEGRVAGVGVTSMAETVVFLGADGEPCAPSIAWYDERGGQEAAELASIFGGPAFSARTGLRVSHLCTLAKLAWLARHGGVPGARALNVADWVVHRMGGEQAAEASLATRSGALCLADRSWWGDGLAWAGAPEGYFPPVVQAGTALGRVGGAAIEALAAQGGAPSLARLEGAWLASAGHDHMCVAAGAGVVHHDQVLDSCGTAEALVRAMPVLAPAEVGRVVELGLNTGWHTLPGCYYLVKGQTMGLLLERVLNLLGVKGQGALDALEHEAMGVSAGSLKVSRDGQYGAPSITGLGPDSSPSALWNAALDCVTAGTAQTLETMARAAGPVRELVLTGGWSHSPGLRRAKRSLTESARWPAVAEAGARGAALFGGCAAGLFDSPFDFPRPEDRPWDTDVTGGGGRGEQLPSAEGAPVPSARGASGGEG